MGKVHSMGDLTGIAERKDRVLRMKEQLLLKVQTKVMMVSPSPSAIGVSSEALSFAK